VESGLAAAARFGAEFSDADRDGYVSEMTASAELVGVPPGRAAASVAELDAYFAAVRPELTLSPGAADTARYLTEMPAIEPELADVWQVVAAAAVTSLPSWARDLYGWSDAVAPDRTEVRQVLGVLDAIYLGEPGVLEGRQRLAVRMRAAESAR
jgi:uncharacterized protein (DUF2236 family)